MRGLYKQCSTSQSQKTLTIQISVIAANQGDNMFESVLWVDNFQWVDGSGVAPPFTLTATTTTGTGDITGFGVTGIPPASSDCLILISATPAPNGLGTGLAFGLEPDAFLVATLFVGES